jgi:hypothetical protein
MLNVDWSLFDVSVLSPAHVGQTYDLIIRIILCARDSVEGDLRNGISHLFFTRLHG